jgi:hypothetical protein
MFKPIQAFPERIPLDIVEHFREYIVDKTVCDIGSGAGDILEFMKFNNLCKEVKGIEIDNKFKNLCINRQYIKIGDVFNLGIPEADVYLFWLGVQFPYEKILDQIRSKKIIIYMDGSEDNHKIFQKYKGIKLIKEITYNYDEAKYGLLKIPPHYLKINNKWSVKGTRIFKIYDYNP